VQRVIQLYRTWIARDLTVRNTQYRELRMSILESSDMFCKMGAAPDSGKIAVALCARLIFRRHQIHSPAMLYMAFRARQLGVPIRSMVRRSIMASQASGIRSARGKSTRLLHVAGCALLFQNAMSRAQPPARINPIVMR
jgi:hypothetical protein